MSVWLLVRVRFGEDDDYALFAHEGDARAEPFDCGEAELDARWEAVKRDDGGWEHHLDAPDGFWRLLKRDVTNG